MSDITLDDLIQDNDGFDFSKGGASDRRFFELSKSYAVTITNVEPKSSKNGYLQAEVTLTLAGTDKKAGRKWLMLPVFTKDMAAGLDNEKIVKLKQSFGKKLHGFLRAADPGTYSVYDRLDKSGKKWKFFLADGTELTEAQKKARERQVSELVIHAAQALATGKSTESLVGKTIYLVETQDKKDPTKFYENWYSTLPENYEIGHEG